MKKRVLSLLLAFVLIAGLLPAGALAAGDDAIEISTKEQLAEIQKTAGNYILMADIELDADWTPLADSYNAVHLDGNGHTITLNGKPLFEKINSDSSVSNLVLAGSVTSASHIGSLTIILNGNIRNCVSYANVEYTGASGGFFPNAVGGLVGYINTSAGTVQNSVYAGTLTSGQADLYGAVANYKDFATGKIENCIGIGDKVGMSEGFSSNTDIALGSNTLIANAADFTPASYVSQLNTNRDVSAGDLEWEVKDGRLSLKRAPEAPAATPEEITALQAAVDKTVDSSKIYTANSWSAYAEALTQAQRILGQVSPKRDAVLTATTALNTAHSGLTERSLSAVDLTEQEVTSITTVSGLKSMQSGKYYQLDADIEITSSDSYFPNELNAVVDGNGHTITISAKKTTIWSTLGPNAVVQNLGVKGSVSSSNNAGAIAQSSQGLIVNCWSLADVTTAGLNNIQKHTGGLVGELQSGGAIVNCYVAGNVTANGSQGGGSAGVLAGSTAANSLIQTCYGLTDTFKGTGEGAVRDCAVKARKDFYSPAFLALLNQNRGTYGKEWTLSDQGYPHLGEAGSYTPPEAAAITFTYPDGRAVTFKSDEGLTVSLQDASNYTAGKFSMTGAARWQDTIVGNKDVLLVTEDGTLSIYKPGSADVVAISSEADGSKELVRFTVTVVQGGEIDGFRLTLQGQDVGGSLTLQGSEQVTLTPEILRSAVWSPISASQVQFSHTGALHQVGGAIYAEEPGEMALTATYMDKTVTVNITSTFVAVTGIKPSPSGTYTIHQRNTNAQPLGAFINLTLSDNAGTVTIEPENASYRDKWTMTSSDDTVAEYVSSMLLAVLPKKAGTVTLTAVVEASGQQPRVEGTSQITIAYKNPVTAVAVTGTAFTVKEREELSLPITFTGQRPASEGLRVTEPAMNWSFASADGGEVEIVTDGSPIVTTSLENGTLLCEANDRYKLVGVTAGTVTVTGTPQDQTGGAQPVTFTVTVEAGAPLVPADNAALTAAGIANGQTYLTANVSDCRYGNEWEVFSLRRSGQTIPQEKIDAYLTSVESTYKNSPDATAMKPTTIARVALALGALGQNASDFRGLNFAEMLYNSARIGEGGNEPMWALIALDSRDYTVPADALWTRDKLATELIVSYQTPDGGFGLNDNKTASVDMTAMAIQALAPYYNTRQDIKTAVDKALTYLKSKMDSTCGFDGNAESTSQVVIALTALGLDPVDGKNGFVRNVAVNLLTNLTKFAQEGGGYKHYTSDQGAQPMSTTQVLIAFEAYRRLAAGESCLYDLTDASDARSVLAQRLAEAGALRETDYTTETWSALRSAATEAQAVLDNAGAGEEALKAADAALAAALAGLKRVSGGGGNPDVPQDTITVTFRLVGDTKHASADEHDRYVNWVRTMSVTVPKGSTVYDVFSEALAQRGMDFEENQTSYISGIQAPGALGGFWLREFDNGPHSGWKYLVNGTHPGVGLRYYWVKDGDKVIWHYTDDHTDSADNNSKWQEAADTEPTASGAGGGTADGTKDETGVTTQLTPEAAANAKGEAAAAVTGGDLRSAIAQAKSDKADAIVIAPQIKGDASKISVELPKNGVDNIASQTGAALRVETSIADITIPRQGLQGLAGQSGSKVVISAEAVKDSVKIAVTVDGKAAEQVDGGLLVRIPAAETSGSVLILVDAGGGETVIKKSVADGSALLALLDGSATVKVADNAKTFRDTADHWAKEAVAFASSRELFNGTGAGAFSPDAPMSRAMLATVLYRLEDAQSEGGQPFADVAADTWYTGAVAWASASHIVNGTGTGFAPDRDISRQELVVMLYRYAKSIGMDTEKTASLSRYADSQSVADWAADAMGWAVASGLVSGRTASTLAPAGTATRGEVAAIMQRLVTRMVR